MEFSWCEVADVVEAADVAAVVLLLVVELQVVDSADDSAEESEKYQYKPPPVTSDDLGIRRRRPTCLDDAILDLTLTPTSAD